MKSNSWKGDLPALAGVVLLYWVLHLLGIGCPIRFVTGISCAGCGMTRAWLSVLALDFPAAFYYHPLWPLIPPAGVVWLLRTRIPPRVVRALAYGAAILFLAVYLFRLLDPANPVVTFEPRTGFAARMLTRLIQSIQHIQYTLR